jgi:hypothetical protein
MHDNANRMDVRRRMGMHADGPELERFQDLQQPTQVSLWVVVLVVFRPQLLAYLKEVVEET